MITKPILSLNAAEKYLAGRLQDALLLEKSMKSVRDKYKELWDRICQHTYPDLNCRNAVLIDAGNVGLGKVSWPSVYKNWPSGFYVGGVSLENLCRERDETPYLSLWIHPPAGLTDLNHITKYVASAAKSAGLDHDDSKGQLISFWRDLGKSREELLDELTHNGGQQFVDGMIQELESFRPLVPVIDEVFDRAPKPPN